MLCSKGEQTTMRGVRAVVTMIWMFFATFLVMVGMSLVFPFAPSGKLATPLAHAWARSILAIAGVKVSVQNAENLKGHGPCIYVCTHQANLDPIAIFPQLPGHVRIVCKASLRWVPFLGLALAAARFIFIDRSNRTKAIASMDVGTKRIRGGISVLVFGEGRRSRDGELMPFKKGSFHLAAAAKVPIIPVVVLGTARLMPPGTALVHAGEVTLRIGKAIMVGPDDTPDTLRERSFVAMQGLMDGDVDPSHPKQQ